MAEAPPQPRVEFDQFGMHSGVFDREFAMSFGDALAFPPMTALGGHYQSQQLEDAAAGETRMNGEEMEYLPSQQYLLVPPLSHERNHSRTWDASSRNHELTPITTAMILLVR